MRGSIVKRCKDSWNVVIDLPAKEYVDSQGITRRKRQQKWFTVHGTKRDAEAKLAELLNDLNQGRFVEPSKITVGQWLEEWLETVIKPTKRLRTYQTYQSVIENHLKPALGAIRLQQLRAADIQRYYNASELSPTTLTQHHAILASALKAATLQGLVARNVASLVVGKPHVKDQYADVLANCWTAEEARRFLLVAKQAGPQEAAFYALALDSGMRKGELCGLKWEDVDLEAGKVSVVRQLVKGGAEPVFGPIKNGQPRTIDISSRTVALLRKHRAHQLERKLANGAAYHDYGLVFAKDSGDPLQANNLGERQLDRLIKAAGVKRIRFHGLRHTCATLMLQAGVPAKVVQERLGHKRIEITLNAYAHVLPGMQEDAVKKLEAILQA